MGGEAVQNIYFALPRCIPIFLQFLLLFSALYVSGGKTACSVPISSGWWFVVSTLGCLCWKPLFVPKGWSLWTTYWRLKSSALLLARVLSLFPIGIPIEKGVPRGSRSLSSSRNFPRGCFRLLPCSLIKGVGEWWVRTPVRILLAGPPVGTAYISYDINTSQETKCSKITVSIY